MRGPPSSPRPSKSRCTTRARGSSSTWPSRFHSIGSPRAALPSFKRTPPATTSAARRRATRNSRRSCACPRCEIRTPLTPGKPPGRAPRALRWCVHDETRRPRSVGGLQRPSSSTCAPQCTMSPSLM
eukprot:2967750-Prymnesium_polylepis.1